MHVKVPNLAQEKNVECINYGLGISCTKILTTVSQRHGIESAGNLITDCKPGSYKNSRFQAKEIEDVMKQWNNKTTVLQEQRYDKNKLINAKKESSKLKDLT